MKGKKTLPSPEEKQRVVQEMFSSIAPRYDLNNTLLSMGLHHRWKRLAIQKTRLRPSDQVLDLCSGTGDLALLMAKTIGPEGKVVALDLNEKMLQIGKKKMKNAGLHKETICLIGTAEILPFPNSIFDVITVAFGIRNVTEIRKALGEMFRVLRPKGRMVSLEFSAPKNPFLRKLYGLYSFTCLPWVATWVSSDKAGTYHYLPASIRNFPDQESFKKIMTDIGFENVSYQNLSGGIVAIHTGIKPTS